MKKNTFWKFNSSLLRDYAYLKEINEEEKKVVEEYAVILYDRQEMYQYADNYPLFNLQYPTSCSSISY